jgi:tetratricopeptide (TPR) repeat protein
MTFGRQTWIRAYLLASCTVLALCSRGGAADGNSGGLSVEWAYAANYPEADCAKIHVYVRNNGRFPMFIEGIHLGDRYLSFNADMEETRAQGIGAGSDLYQALNTRKENNYSYIARKTNGNVQWFRALANPVLPGVISDVAVSLWGTLEETPIRIIVRGGQELRWNAKEEKRPLRLSHVAFDPANPNKVYVYVENSSGEEIAIDRLQVDSELLSEFQAIPAGGKIKAGGKTCIIADLGKRLKWGDYLAIGVVGRKAERVLAVVRVINFFPIGNWSDDKRETLFFDNEEFMKPLPPQAAPSTPDDSLTIAAPADFRRANCACYDGMDVTCLGNSYEDNARKIIQTMSSLRRQEPALPYFTHICKPSLEGYAFYGELPDMAFVNPFTTLFRAPYSPEASAGFLKAARTWIDPRPIAAIPEAFSNDRRDLTPDEIASSTWAEIGEGAKGVRYYVATYDGDGRGYSQMPGAEQAIAHINLDLQLLKAFLRVSDTCNAASSDREKVACKSLLCGDKGMVVILRNGNYTGGKKVAALWTPMENVAVRVHVPIGLQLRHVFEVAQGLKAVEFSEEGDCVNFTVPRLEGRRVFLLSSFQRANAAVAAGRNQDAPSARSVSEIVAEYSTQLLKLAKPLLKTDVLVEESQAVEIGLRMGSLRSGTIEQLARIEGQMRSVAPDKRMPLTVSLAQAYLELGALQRAESLCRSAVDDASDADRGKTCSPIARCCLEAGEYALAAGLYERAFQAERDVGTRFDLAGRCLDLFEKKLLDQVQAIHWAVVRANLEGVPPESSARARIDAGELLLGGGKPDLALEQLEKVSPADAKGLPLQYFLAQACMKAGKPDEAIEHFGEVAAQDRSRAAEAQYMIGRLLLSERRYDKARVELEKVWKQYPHSEYAENAKELAGRIESREQGEK